MVIRDDITRNSKLPHWSDQADALVIEKTGYLSYAGRLRTWGQVKIRSLHSHGQASTWLSESTIPESRSVSSLVTGL